MKFVKQKVSLPIANMDEYIDNKKTELKSKHGSLFPNSIRALICGPSNCGKSNVLISLMLHENGLRFENVYIFSKSLYQNKYKLLERMLNGIVNYYPFSDNCEIVNVNDAQTNSLFIFDDVACDKQDKIREYFCMGRHKNVDVFYLCQSYTRIPKHLIRDNANFLILFKQDDLNLRHVYDDHVGGDMTFKQFKKLCNKCWREKYGFLVIDKESEQSRYRCGIDRYIVI